MKVTEIRTIPLLGETPPTGWSRGTSPGENLYTLVEIETDAGLTGIGSCFTTTALVDASLEVLRPLLLGQNALEPDRLSESLLQTSFWHGRGGAVTTTLSGIDIALWDILGQALAQPVGRLLGGIYRQRIKAYASMLFAEPPVLRERLLELTGRGFRAIKLGWIGFGRSNRCYDELLVRTARETVGAGVELMVDAGGSEEFWPHTYKWALDRAHVLAAYDVYWFEEPLSPDDVEGFALLREHAPVPIATGEALTRRQSFRPLFERRAVDIVQPDTTKVGGLSEARRLAWAAYDCGIAMVSHGWNTALGLAADLHLAAAMPIASYVEYQVDSPYIDGLVTTPFRLDEEGCLAIPSGPGLGVELDPDAVARLSRSVGAR